MNPAVPSDSTSTEFKSVGRALIVTTDTALAAVVQEALTSVAIDSERCDGTVTSFGRVRNARFEAAFIDFHLAAPTIEAIRSSPSNRTAIVIAITTNPEQSKQAFARGVHFVVQQPLSRSSLDAIVRAAYGLIVRERRRYFRCPLEVGMVAHRTTEAAWSGQASNVSEGGMCISGPTSLKTGEALEVEFRLPVSSAEISAECDVQWADENGRAGLRFIRMRQESRSDLMHWLTDQLDKQIGAKMAAFQQRSAAAAAEGCESPQSRENKKKYETPLVNRYQMIEELPVKLRAVAQEILKEQPALKVMLDEQHQSVSVSEEFAHLLGYNSRELLGRPIDDITSKGTVDIEFTFRMFRRFKETKGLWLFEGRRGKKLLCSYKATRIADKVTAEFTPLLVSA
jgi:PAS domain-containing protein